LRGVLDALEQPVIATDGRGTIWTANLSAVRTLRRPMSVLIGTNLAALLRVPRRSYGPHVDAAERFLEIVSTLGPGGGTTDRTSCCSIWAFPTWMAPPSSS